MIAHKYKKKENRYHSEYTQNKKATEREICLWQVLISLMTKILFSIYMQFEECFGSDTSFTTLNQRSYLKLGAEYNLIS